MAVELSSWQQISKRNAAKLLNILSLWSATHASHAVTSSCCLSCHTAQFRAYVANAWFCI